VTNKTFLRQVSLFSGLSDKDLRELESVVRERSFRKNEVIFHAQEPGNALFVIRRGRVKISMDDKSGREITRALADYRHHALRHAVMRHEGGE